jgi:hypothetical protein
MNKLRLWAGIAMLVVSLFIPLLGIWVAGLALPVGVKGLIIGVLTFGGPEVLAFIAVALLGKETFNAIVGKVLPLLHRLAPHGSVSRTRYTVGLIMFLLSYIPSIVVAYTPSLLPDVSPNRLYISLGGDILFILSLFVLGGDFWDKLRALFIYDARAEFPRGEKNMLPY